MPLAVIPTQEDHMNTAQAKNPTMKVVPAAAPEEIDDQPRTNDASIAEVLRAAHARMEAETAADEKNKAEVDALIAKLIEINARKREIHRVHAEARIERQADAAAQEQVEADSRDAVLEQEGKVLFQIRQKLYGKYTLPIFLPGEQRPTVTPKAKKRRWWK